MRGNAEVIMIIIISLRILVVFENGCLCFTFSAFSCVEFVIEKSGKVTSARVVRGEDKHLRQEALRLVRSIPTMIPAKQRGTAVAVTFTLPINFSLQ